MKKLITIVCLWLICALFIALFANATYHKAVFAQGELEDFYIVKYSEIKTRSEIADIYNISIDKVQELSEFGAFRIELKDVASQGGYSPDNNFLHNLEYYEPDYRYRLPNLISSGNNSNKVDGSATPNDPYYPSQWGLPKISANSAWDKTTGSTNVKIAIIDTGIDGTHEDLSGKVLAGYDYVNSRSISANSDSDDQGHGTTVAGVAAAISNNSVGVAGTDWNARLMPIKVLDSTGTGYASDVAYGIRYAADNGADVINMSLGSSSSSSLISSAVDYAYSAGVVMVAASGNGNTTPISYPARYEKVLAVGATNSSDVRCDNSDWGYPYGSNYGSDLGVVAPGNAIYGPRDGGGYRSVSGTSLSSPFVAGIASLLLAYNSYLSVDNIYSAIKDNADKVAGMGGENFSIYYGYGRVNANNALSGSETYIATWVSQSSYFNIWPDGTQTLTLAFKNDGTATWTNSGSNPVRLATDKFQDESFMSKFNDGSWVSTYRIANLNESSVVPGQTGSFTFNVKAPSDLKIGYYRFFVRMVAENKTWFQNPNTNGGAWWGITVPAPKATWVSQSEYPVASAGDTVAMSVTYKNNTGVTWNNSSPAIRLATDKFQNEGFMSTFNNGSWVSTYRIANLSTATVGDGSNATFNFNIKIPNDLSPGIYRFFVRLVAENFSWFQDPDTNGGAWWRIEVTE